MIHPNKIIVFYLLLVLWARLAQLV